MDLTSTLAEPVPGTRSQARPQQQARAQARVPRAVKTVEAALLLVAAVFFALHFVHLKADFPNHSPWMDWAKYTDEGWYGDAAIRHYQLGHWNLPGDFNPAAALPVWPVLEMALFRATGVSLVAARALTVVVFGLTLICCYALLQRWPNAGPAVPTARGPSLAPAIAVLLLAVSPYCFAFSRLAILEPLLILLTLVALLVASSAGAAAVSEGHLEEATLRAWLTSRPARWAIALGLLLPLMVLTKTTGIFLFPAIFWMLFASTGYRLRPSLRIAALAGAVGTAAWSAYYGLFVHPHYLLDYRYLFAANGYTGVTLKTLGWVLHDAIFDVMWIGATMFVLALAAVAGLLVYLGVRGFRGNPLVVSLLLWVFGYGAFLAYHANLQPRYYLVIAIPLTMLVAIAFDALLAEASAAGKSERIAWLLRATTVVAGGAIAFAVLAGARQTILYVLHPEYTWVSAAAQIHDAIERGTPASAVKGSPTQSPLVLSISGSDLSLMTGLRSICDDFGTMTLPERLAAYKPGWFATWNHVEDDKMEALAPMYRLVRVMAVPAFDDPERNLLILYRLDPIAVPGQPGRPGRRRSLSVPRKLRTKVGEQPTLQQLRH